MSEAYFRKSRAVFLLWAGLIGISCSLQAQEFEVQAGESVEYVTDPALLGQDRLETTVYRPLTRAPWPLVVLNHGNDADFDKHDQPRWRPGWVAGYFARQGYMVVVPMRRGYAGSSGTFSYNCNPIAFGDRAADDIEAVIRYYIQRNEAKSGQVLVIGGSQGGWVALAYASKYDSARGVINIDGGIAYPESSCYPGWQDRLIEAGRVIGAHARMPSLWMYALDDETFPPTVSLPFFNAYHGAGAHARLVTVASGGHSFMWGASRNEAAWRTTVEKFVTDLGLPAGIVTN
jgi:pimeloyl-ACP methyl ester carboxylesterase